MKKLDDFDRGVRVDGPCLRQEIQLVRQAHGVGRGSPIADSTWSEWRSMAFAKKSKQSYSQREAAIITWIAFYSFSGKAHNNNLPFSKIPQGKYPSLTNDWIKAIQGDPQSLSVRRVLKYIYSTALTPDQIIELVQSAGEQASAKKRGLSKRTIQRWASKAKEPLKADRPLSQKFVRQVVRQTVLKPVKTSDRTGESS